MQNNLRGNRFQSILRAKLWIKRKNLMKEKKRLSKNKKKNEKSLKNLTFLFYKP